MSHFGTYDVAITSTILVKYQQIINLPMTIPSLIFHHQFSLARGRQMYDPLFWPETRVSDQRLHHSTTRQQTTLTTKNEVASSFTIEKPREQPGRG